MSKLEQAMKVFAPCWDGHTFMVITGKVGFEPHGRASETWSPYYNLELPTITHHWKSLDGWKEGNPKFTMNFHGRTIEEVVAKATKFLEENPHLPSPPSKR